MSEEPQAPAAPREDRLRGLARLPTHPGLCADCRHLRLLASRRSVFVRCGKAEEDERFPRYPALPVRECAGYEREAG
ncbi:MAG TPA: hypothetical protein VN783_09970 [Thermoanaerobaculia bacterium]|nr:hypothetical protein [Thermoanaerobaculia bacterium]